MPVLPNAKTELRIPVDVGQDTPIILVCRHPEESKWEAYLQERNRIKIDKKREVKHKTNVRKLDADFVDSLLLRAEDLQVEQEKIIDKEAQTVLVDFHVVYPTKPDDGPNAPWKKQILRPWKVWAAERFHEGGSEGQEEDSKN